MSHGGSMLTTSPSRTVRSEAKDQHGVVICRCFQADPAALDDLVELLHRLLLDDAGTELPDSMTAVTSHQTCFPVHVE
jgi:hypothetical protein